MILWPLFFVLFQNVTDGLVKQLVRRTLLVNGENLELFEQLTVNGCCKSLSFSHGFLYIAHPRNMIQFMATGVSFQFSPDKSGLL